MIKEESANPRIAVLVLGYNNLKDLKGVLGSVQNQSYENFQLIYIDNASTDNSVVFVRKNYPRLPVIRSSKNLGYAKAYKKVLERVFKKGFAAAVLLNSDVAVSKDWLCELVRSAFKDKRIASAQPKIFLGKSNLLNTSGNKINFLGFGFCGNYKEKDGPRFKKDREIAYASGASLLVKRKPYLKIGGLDENYQFYLEDQDLGWRAWLRGYRVIFCARSKMQHKYRFSKNSKHKQKFYLLERNRLYFIFKNYQVKTLFLITPALLFMEVGILFDSLTKGYFLQKIRSYGGFVRNFKKLIKERREVQRLRKLSDRELFSKLSPTVEFEEIDNPLLKIANIFLLLYYRAIKKII